jgi:transcription termination factor Rho
MPPGKLPNLKKRSSNQTESHVAVADLQRADLAQLNAVAKQLRLSVSKDISRDELLHSILVKYTQEGRTLIGSGTLQILPDGFGFLRSLAFDYLSSSEDIYVSPSQIRKFNLGDGSVVSGHIRPPKENERYFALLRVSQVNGLEPQQAAEMINFEDLKPLTPDTAIRFETGPNEPIGRIVDLMAPIGFGQRSVVVSPPRAGKTNLVKTLCGAIQTNHPTAYVCCVMIDERPEDVRDLRKELASDRCEVIASMFDESAARHSDVANIVLEKAKRMVETGEEVIVIFDSLTDFARAELEFDKSWQSAREDTPLKADALPLAKSFLRSAMRSENGGSLTIIATLHVDTDFSVDDQIRDALRGLANHEILLDQALVQQRIWPAINIHKSSTHHEETLLGEATQPVHRLRRTCGEKQAAEAMELLLSLLDKYATNDELLESLDEESN